MTKEALTQALAESEPFQMLWSPRRRWWKGQVRSVEQLHVGMRLEEVGITSRGKKIAEPIMVVAVGFRCEPGTKLFHSNHNEGQAYVASGPVIPQTVVEDPGHIIIAYDNFDISYGVAAKGGNGSEPWRTVYAGVPRALASLALAPDVGEQGEQFWYNGCYLRQLLASK